MEKRLLESPIHLVLGFIALTYSEMRSQAFYGILLSSSLVATLVADFFFMPALVLIIKPFGPEGIDAEAGAPAELSEAAWSLRSKQKSPWTIYSNP